MVIDYSTLRTRLCWLAWPTVLSAVLLGHFVVSVGFWAVWLVNIWRNPSMRDEFFPSLWAAAPAFALCALSAGVFALALRGNPVAGRRVLFLAAVTAAFFAVDVYFARWQIHIFIATKEYWADGGRAHEYFTWWWFNDRWFW